MAGQITWDRATIFWYIVCSDCVVLGVVLLLRLAVFCGVFIYHKYDYRGFFCSRVDSQTKCKFCTNTESCMEYEEWEPTTVT